MFEKAVEKLKTEMSQNKDNSYIQQIGLFLLQYLEAAPELADKFLHDDKTISKSLSFMESEARKRKGKGNCVMFTPQEGFEIILKFFGVLEATPVVPEPVIPSIKPPAPEKKSIDFDFKLEDFT